MQSGDFHSRKSPLSCLSPPHKIGLANCADLMLLVAPPLKELCSLTKPPFVKGGVRGNVKIIGLRSRLGLLQKALMRIWRIGAFIYGVSITHQHCANPPKSR